MKIWYQSDIKTYKLFSVNADDKSEESESDMFSNEQKLTLEIPDENFIKVKLSKIGVASTDISGYLGKYKIYPIVPGRSGVAYVSESNHQHYKQGQLVYLTPYIEDHNGFKVRGVNCNGYMGDFMNVPLSNVIDIPDGVTDEEMIFTEDIALAINALESLKVEKAEYVVIYGASVINCIIAQLCIYYQTIPIVVDNDENRLALAQNSGVYYTINPAEENSMQKVIEITGGKLADHLIFDADCFSNLDDQFNLVKDKGKACLIGYNKYINPINCNMSKVVASQLQIFGIRNGLGEIHTAINLLANKIIKFDSFIEQTGSFEDYPEFIKRLSDKPGYRKSIVKFS